MKICFITNSISKMGGVQRVLAVIASELSRYNDVSIIFVDGGADGKKEFYFMSDDIIRIHNRKLKLDRFIYYPYKILRYLNRKLNLYFGMELSSTVFFPKAEKRNFEKFFYKNHFDIIIGVQGRLSVFVGQLKCPGIKIGWFHSTYEAYFKRKGYHYWQEEKLYKKLLPSLDRLVVLTNRDAAIYSKKMNVDVTRIYNPITIMTNKKSKLDTNNLLFVGRLLYEQKGLGLLTDILEQLKEQRIEFHLDVVGDGCDRKKFLDECQKKNLLDYINFAGETKNVMKYYLNATIFVFPSKCEGFGLVVTEAMSCGVPVISFKTEGPSEIIEDGINGYLVEKFSTHLFAERIIELLNDRQKRLRMGEEASKRALDFSLRETGAEWQRLFGKLLNGSTYNTSV